MPIGPSEGKRGEAGTPRCEFRPHRLHACGKALLVATLLAGAVAFAQQNPAPDVFAAKRAEAEKANGGHRAKLFVELARDEMEAADRAFTAGDADTGHKLAQASAADAGQSAQAALTSGKRLKDTEIDLRKLETRTGNIGQSLAFDDRPPMQKIVQQMEQLRQSLLDRMFSGKKGKS